MSENLNLEFRRHYLLLRDFGHRRHFGAGIQFSAGLNLEIRSRETNPLRRALMLSAGRRGANIGFGSRDGGPSAGWNERGLKCI